MTALFQLNGFFTLFAAMSAAQADPSMRAGREEGRMPISPGTGAASSGELES